MYLRGGNKKHLFPGNGNNEIKSFKRALISYRLKKIYMYQRFPIRNNY